MSSNANAELVVPPSEEVHFSQHIDPLQPGVSWVCSESSKFLHTHGVRRGRTMCDSPLPKSRHRLYSTPENPIAKQRCEHCEKGLGRLEAGAIDLPPRHYWPCDLSRFVAVWQKQMVRQTGSAPGDHWFVLDRSPAFGRKPSRHSSDFRPGFTLCGAPINGASEELLFVKPEDSRYDACKRCDCMLDNIRNPAPFSHEKTPRKYKPKPKPLMSACVASTHTNKSPKPRFKSAMRHGSAEYTGQELERTPKPEITPAKREAHKRAVMTPFVASECGLYHEALFSRPRETVCGIVLAETDPQRYATEDEAIAAGLSSCAECFNFDPESIPDTEDASDNGKAVDSTDDGFVDLY